MSKFNWRNGFATGLFVGIGIVLLFVVLLDANSPTIDPTTGSAAECSAKSDNCAHDNEKVPDRWYWLRRALSVEDTLAQWIMMTFTVAAAVLLLATLKATQEMARDTRRIGEAQVRAYLGREACAAWEGIGVEFDGAITNCGNSPAINVYMMLELIYWEKISVNTFNVRQMYTVPKLVGSIPSNGRVGTGRISFVGFFRGSTEGGVFDVRSANICLLGRDVFGGEVSFFGGIGYFQGFEEYEKKKSHPGYLSPDGFHGDQGKAMEAMRDWVAKNHR